MEKLKQLRLLLRKIRWRSPSSKSLKVCPRCGSINIRFSSKLDAWLTPKQYVCDDCGYVGPIVLEIEETKEEKEEGND